MSKDCDDLEKTCAIIALIYKHGNLNFDRKDGYIEAKKVRRHIGNLSTLVEESRISGSSHVPYI